MLHPTRSRTHALSRHVVTGRGYLPLVEVDELLREHGTTYAEQAGITLRNKPAPLYQLLVLTTLSSIRISADTAAEAAHELFRAGWRTPERMRASTWQQRVDALGRGGYRRYDESTATYLDDSATMVLEEHGGDLRGLRRGRSGTTADLAEALQRFPRVGPTGASIFCREVQAVWPEVAPFFDRRALDSARELGLPTDPERLAALVPAHQVAALSAALVRHGLQRGRGARRS
ncbi:endonuclease [Nocardioides sp. MAHUQ-72]|uniref:endonuclease n=1 Tax=unclassified Nocardioides TaxID=2615069 RepID=UPI00360C4799